MVIDELRDLRYFIEVARCASFGIAASKLEVSISAISKAVTRLERSTGTPLLVRASRGIRLSSEGQELFDKTESRFTSLEESLEDIHQRGDLISGVVHISAFTMFGRIKLAPLLPKFLALYPRVELSLSFHDSQRGVSRDSFDIRITWAEKLDEDKVSRVLGPLPSIMVGSPDYLARQGVPQAPDDLMQHECITGLMPSGARVRWSFREKGVQPGESGQSTRIVTPPGRVVVQDEMSIVAEIAREGLGLTLVNPDYIAQYLADGSLVRVLAGYHISTTDEAHGRAVMQYRRQPYLSRAARAFVEYLTDNMPGTVEPAKARCI